MIKRLGKSRQYVTAIANERRRASVATYARFAEALDVPLAALFDGYPLDLLSPEELPPRKKRKPTLTSVSLFLSLGTDQ